MVYFGGVSGVCHDWQFDFDRSFTMRLCIAQLHVAGSHRYFVNNFWSKIKWQVWLIHPGLVSVQYIKVSIERVYLRLFLPQSTSWVYIFIIKHFELGSQTQDQSDYLALAFFLVYKLTFLCVCVCVWVWGGGVCVCVCENRQYLTQIQMEMFLVYFIRLIFTLNGWKLLRFVNVFVCLFSFRAQLKIAPVTWVFPDSYYAGSGATIWQIRSTHLDAECSGHFQSTPRIY